MKPRTEENTSHRSLPTALKCCVLLSLVTCAAIATPVEYTFFRDYPRLSRLAVPYRVVRSGVAGFPCAGSERACHLVSER